MNLNSLQKQFFLTGLRSHKHDILVEYGMHDEVHILQRR